MPIASGINAWHLITFSHESRAKAGIQVFPPGKLSLTINKQIQHFVSGLNNKFPK